jgi:hypothetical protein
MMWLPRDMARHPSAASRERLVVAIGIWLSPPT